MRNLYLISLRSKRFREAKSEEKAKNGGFGVLPARKWGESKTKKKSKTFVLVEAHD